MDIFSEIMLIILCLLGFLKWGTPTAGWFIMQHPPKMNDLRVPPFEETSIQTHFDELFNFLLQCMMIFMLYIIPSR